MLERSEGVKGVERAKERALYESTKSSSICVWHSRSTNLITRVNHAANRGSYSTASAPCCMFAGLQRIGPRADSVEDIPLSLALNSLWNDNTQHKEMKIICPFAFPTVN